MNDNEKKEFINDIMNFGDSFDDKMYEDFCKSSTSDFKSEVIKNLLGEDVDPSKLNYSYEGLMEYCKQGNIDPMELMDWAFSMISTQDDITIQGHKLELSKADSILSELKEKFSQYKKSEDINNF